MQRHFLLLFLCGLTLTLSSVAHGDITDPFDPFDSGMLGQADKEESDDQKTVPELLMDASQLFMDERPLDARTKLLKALKKDPKQYRTHMLLAGYYIQHVGHFRLALRYAKQAEGLLYEKNGKPPYRDFIVESEHKQVLYLLTQARLNLDNYQGALDTLDEYASYGYLEDWYPGTRSWVLMKLGRLDEAIQVARLGVLSGAEAGRAFNMLGILLSMKGEREQSLQVFREAITYELSLGKEGQPATPLNNSGEVYKEIFQDARAESSWLKATSLPDGCEHVLPSLNLALLYIDQLHFAAAKRTMDSFEACVAQFPLRNGEEHRALVHLARGRIDLHTGNIDSAVKHLEEALANRQWFGKIGTDVADLEAGALISLSQALDAQNSRLLSRQSTSIAERVENLQTRATNAVRSWWLKRRARQILSEDLSDFEDLNVRHTDSLLEYPTLGTVLNGFPRRLLEQRISVEEQADNRSPALPYYRAYLAEALLEGGLKQRAVQILDEVERSVRPQLDDLLLVYIRTLKMKALAPSDPEYRRLAQLIYVTQRAALRNAGLALPVNFTIEPADGDAIVALNHAGFFLDNSTELQYAVVYEHGQNEHLLSFEPRRGGFGGVRVRGNDFDQMLNRFSDEVFAEDLESKK